MNDKDFIRRQRAKLNMFDDFLTQQQIDEILSPLEIDEMQEVANLMAEYAALLNE